MTSPLTIEQRFALTRARYEVTRMSRPALEKTALRLLKSRMEQKNGVQETLMASGIVFKIDDELTTAFVSANLQQSHEMNRSEAYAAEEDTQV